MARRRDGRRVTVGAPWYRKAFGPLYTDLYAHRDRAEAERVAELLSARVPLRGARVLDAACGAGRHLGALRRRGADASGFDLSDELLRGASKIAPVARADMRAFPFRDGVFHGVLNMFTSFGYFPGEENGRVLDETARVLGPGGWFLLDYLNPAGTVERLVPESERTLDDFRIRETRRYDPERRVLSKEIEVLSGGGAVRDRWREEVRLFSVEELERMLLGRGLKIRERFGDYEGGGFHRDSPRLILLSTAE
ncbi:MAG: class I SAM-dependent methyltransferase [Candidatus Eisenbacteria bacterium]